jgi:tRNA-splicing ligase RtcB
MSDTPLAPIETWLIRPLDTDVRASIDRLRRLPDVQQVAIMPDVHLANDVCVGAVIATTHRILPQAVGGDIGCGMLAVEFDVDARRLNDPAAAGRILARISQRIPTMRRTRGNTIPLPAELLEMPLSHPSLDSLSRDEGRLQLGTLGGGNHFIELQTDEENRLWLMIHSGSRAMGQAFRSHHMARAEPVGSSLYALDARSASGQAYLGDVAWARRYAESNRRAMADCVADILSDVIGASTIWETAISTDHNHVVPEEHGGQMLWIHRKGAMPAPAGTAGVLPGSMGTPSFHVEGRGCKRSLRSSAHGAGRLLSRNVARTSISTRRMQHAMQGIWYDFRMTDSLREEAPSAYKDIRAVVRAQGELTKITRTLRPVLNYKGR